MDEQPMNQLTTSLILENGWKSPNNHFKVYVLGFQVYMEIIWKLPKFTSWKMVNHLHPWKTNGWILPQNDGIMEDWYLSGFMAMATHGQGCSTHISNHPCIISGLVGGLPSLGGWDPKRSPQLKRGEGACLGGFGWVKLKGWWCEKRLVNHFFLWVILLMSLVTYLYVLHFSFEDACGRTNM